MANRAGGDRPFPPGDYPLIVVGSGPGALQLTYSLGRIGVRHAVISADPAPGGMFRRWPFFQRLLSWTKPYAPAPRGTRTYERYDWNSLIADEPDHRAIQPSLMDGTSYFPSRPEMERNLVTFGERTGLQIRYGCRWTATRREEGSDGVRFVLETTDGEYRAPLVVFAVGVAEPYTPPFAGSELTAHYADTRAPESYADKSLVIIGKQNSGFELASGLLQWARRIIISSPSPTKLSVDTHSLVGVRARYVQPYEDHILGGGVSIINAAMEVVEPAATGGFTVRVRPTAGGETIEIAADEVISATGFVCPLLDLPALGVATFGQARIPAQTPFWQSASVPGIYFAGTIGQGAVGLKKHGHPANSGAVHGARYNARLLARHLAGTQFGIELRRPVLRPADIVDFCQGELTGCPELWHQKAYLARVVTVDPALGLVDDGMQPLAALLDGGGPNAIILTLEADGSGVIYPVVYVRRDGVVEEHVFDADPMLDYGGDAVRSRLIDVLRSVVPDVA